MCSPCLSSSRRSLILSALLSLDRICCWARKSSVPMATSESVFSFLVVPRIATLLSRYDASASCFASLAVRMDRKPLKTAGQGVIAAAHFDTSIANAEAPTATPLQALHTGVAAASPCASAKKSSAKPDCLLWIATRCSASANSFSAMRKFTAARAAAVAETTTESTVRYSFGDSSKGTSLTTPNGIRLIPMAMTAAETRSLRSGSRALLGRLLDSHSLS
mmetsp:Transcript_20922/g.46099  ORF Transcript_20922/g.46099 Transcript_20922/m.46099 type:complete len:220 (-) Transcript_20922:952-1611(-)